MRHDETRDNVTDIEAQIIEADKRAREESAPYPPAYPFPVFGAKAAPEPFQIRKDELPVVEDVDDDDYYEDDGQPDEYTEWQDYMGGDDWDHGQYDDCGW